jgi:hypothetical protein
MSEVYYIHIYYHHADKPDAIKLKNTILLLLNNNDNKLPSNVEIIMHPKREYETSKNLPGRHYLFKFKDEDILENRTPKTMAFAPGCGGVAWFIAYDLHRPLCGFGAY